MALNHHDTLAAIHALIACIAVLFLLPAALLVARFQRGTSSHWVRVHTVLNVWAAIFVIIAFGLGLASVMLNPAEAPEDAAEAAGRRRRRWLTARHGDGDDDNDAPADAGDDAQFIGAEATFHHKMGLVLFILICMQVAWGFTTRYLAHAQGRKRQHERRRILHSSTIGDDGRSITPEPSVHEDRAESSGGELAPSRHWTQWTHMTFGIVLLVLFYVQAWNGLHTEWPNMSQRGEAVPTAVLVLFWVLVAAPVGPYLIHLLSQLLHKGRDRATDREQEAVPMQQRIVTGGPASTTTARLAQGAGAV